MKKKTKKRVSSYRKHKKILGSETKDLVLIRSAIDPDARFFVASEMADDNAIEQEILGKSLEACVYEFSQDGKPVRGLTHIGVKEAVRMINRNPRSGMRIGLDNSRMFTDEVERNGERGILAKCLAVDHVSGDSNWGLKFEPYVSRRKDGSTYRNTFVEEKAVTKAQRNAKQGLIPIGLKTTMIAKFAKQGKVEQIEAPKHVVTAKVLQKTDTKGIVQAIEMKIEKTTNGEDLLDIAEKVEQGKNIPDKEKPRLANLARKKGNALLDKKIANG